MDPDERKRLEDAGYVVVTDVAEWLGLSKAESDFINICLSLRHLIRFARERAGLTQAQAARKLKSSQSRVSKMEAGDPSVSLDLLVTSALTLGATRQEVAAAVAGSASTAAEEQPASAERRSQPARNLKTPRRTSPAKAA
ncbi:DNA-binding transcriptional regulator, XRE-family HTH domain [bacterium JGI 053]|nr:DNA-binding transcriptional regulator, XRE-family HTH domain [bacterium JGI 053]